MTVSRIVRILWMQFVISQFPFCISNSLGLSPRPPLWFSGHCSWLQIQRSRVLFPALRDFVRSSVSGMGSTQPREGNWGAAWMENWHLWSRKSRLTAMGMCCTDHITSSTHKTSFTSSTSGCWSVGISWLQTKSHGVCFVFRTVTSSSS
jgi:hypothetical protein